MDNKHLATTIVAKLEKAGYQAYFAGGWVRDYLMGHPSDDIDIATNAPPEVILTLFPQTILVGLSFGVIIVIEEGHQFEVATFRRDVGYEDGRKPTMIELATPEEDASRRDFTINGMFFDPVTEEVHDFVGGKADIQKKIIRTIGDPYERFIEDRLRMIRAVRFSARFDFPIDEDTQEAIRATADTLFPAVAMERVWQEFNKMAKYPNFSQALVEMHRLGLLPVIFPRLASLHLKELRHRVDPIVHYPKDTHPIFSLMALFPDIKEEEAIEIGNYLKTSAADAALAAYLVKMRKAVKRETIEGLVDLVEWVHLYAHPHAHMALQVIGAHMPPLEKEIFLQGSQDRMEKYKFHIDLAAKKKFLISSSTLQYHGVKPGKGMGKLLKTSERLAIEHEIMDEEQLLLRLKDSREWREYVETN